MNTFLPPDHDLLTLPFSAATDFTDLADYCDRFAVTLMDCDDVMHSQALLGRLSASLKLLRPTLHEPIPPHLIERLTADTLPAMPVHFEPDAEALCDYCQALAHLLAQHSLQPEMEKTLKGLLCELVWMFAGELKAPRWVRGTTVN